MLRPAHLTITVVGQICIPEVAPRAHLSSRFTEGYLPLGRGTHWTLVGLPSAGAESSPQIPLAGPQASLQSGLVVARLRYLQRKLKQQMTPSFRAGPSPPFIRRVVFCPVSWGPTFCLDLVTCLLPLLVFFLGSWHTAALLAPSTGALAP